MNTLGSSPFATCSFADDSYNVGQDLVLLFALELSLVTSDWIGSPSYGLVPAIDAMEKVARRRYQRTKACGVPLRGYLHVANACKLGDRMDPNQFFLRNLFSYSAYVRCLNNGAVKVRVSRPYVESLVEEVTNEEFRWFAHAAARNAYGYLRSY